MLFLLTTGFYASINIDKIMDKGLKEKLKKKLEAEKKKLTNDLKSFAKKDPRLKRNWITRFPLFGLNRTHQDEKADQIEEYENLLPIEHSLEKRLKDTEEALGKIKKGKYGQCEACKKEVEVKRLEVAPEARTCLVCSRKSNNR